MPVGIIKVDQIDGRDPFLKEGGMIVQHGVFGLENEFLPVPQAGGGLKDGAGDGHGRIALIINVQGRVSDHVKNDDLSGFGGQIGGKGGRAFRPGMACDVALIFEVKKNEPDLFPGQGGQSSGQFKENRDAGCAVIRAWHRLSAFGWIGVLVGIAAGIVVRAEDCDGTRAPFCQDILSCQAVHGGRLNLSVPPGFLQFGKYVCDYSFVRRRTGNAGTKIHLVEYVLIGNLPIKVGRRRKGAEPAESGHRAQDEEESGKENEPDSRLHDAGRSR